MMTDRAEGVCASIKREQLRLSYSFKVIILFRPSRQSARYSTVDKPDHLYKYDVDYRWWWISMR